VCKHGRQKTRCDHCKTTRGSPPSPEAAVPDCSQGTAPPGPGDAKEAVLDTAEPAPAAAPAASAAVTATAGPVGGTAKATAEGSAATEGTETKEAACTDAEADAAAAAVKVAAAELLLRF
jgi:hypothetical protein